MGNRYASKKSGQIINSLPEDLRKNLDGIIAEFKENIKIYKRKPNYVAFKKVLHVLIKEFTRHCKRLDEIETNYINDRLFSLVDDGEETGLYVSDDDGREDTHDVAPDETPGQLSKRLRMEAQSHLEHLKKTLADLPIRERKPDISPAAMKRFATGVAEVFRLAGGNPTLPGHKKQGKPTVPGHKKNRQDHYPFLDFSKEAARLAGYNPHSDRAWADIIRPFLD